MPGKYEGNEDESLAERLDNAMPDDETGSVDENGYNYRRIVDWVDPGWPEDNPRQGLDWIITTDRYGFVTVQGYADLDIGPNGYYSPSDDAWAECCADVSSFYADEDEDEDEETCRNCGEIIGTEDHPRGDLWCEMSASERYALSILTED